MRRHYEYLVVGGGVAGGRAVEALSKRADSVALVSAEHWRPYARPPLSKEALVEGRSIEDLCLRDSAWYDDNGAELWLGERVVGLDPTDSVVRLASGSEIGFDRLLLAPGVEPIRLPVPGSELAGVHYLRTYDDAVQLRHAVEVRGRPCRVVVVGGGFIGSELAASLGAMGALVTVVEATSQLMVQALGEEVGALLTRRHRQAGIDVRLDARVERLSGETTVQGVQLADGSELPCDLVVVGIGAKPRLEWLEGSGVELADGIVVDEHCRTSRENVFGAGDATVMYSPRLGRHRRVEHEANAQAQGVVAARNMLGGNAVHDPVDYCWSIQHDLDIWTLGETGRGGEVSVEIGDGGKHALATYRLAGNVVGVVGINRPDDLAPARELLTSLIA
ncbi:FAD-dependent oxidoreductase [Nocardioides aromaticivorans]|uniref:FAD-dependent oxidoreductase n=1 Tax=Nocardioides aromaticivorans TaxID=200618 RepID=Q2HWH5_9ACTN|nr:FAD-dependent oxidoreductase [Nocardioides aromaticivorans]QSR24165.1 FAD-dependent oxidoreductase [Nocardioides aromaticivorans]BAE79503.1 ferredoxin reductase component of carbazole 1,9a-dioxygenase [Nocardioides aromaticivorans]